MTYTPYYPGGWVDEPDTSTPIIADALNNMEDGIGAGLQLQETTGTAGFMLQAAAGTILTWTAPDDGNIHRFIIFADTKVTAAETGGQCEVAYSSSGGGNVTAFPEGGGRSAGQFAWAATLGVLPPAGTVTVSQSSALTAGAATVYVEIWGS